MLSFKQAQLLLLKRGFNGLCIYNFLGRFKN